MVSSFPYLDGVCEAYHHVCPPHDEEHDACHDDLRLQKILRGGSGWELSHQGLAIVKHANIHLKLDVILIGEFSGNYLSLSDHKNFPIFWT